MASHGDVLTAQQPVPLARTVSQSSLSECEKYLRFFCQKAVQIIVEARLGQRVSTASKPNNAEWFNLALNDLPEVKAETKKALNGALPSPGNPLCVEISLNTADGDVVTLECWCLNVGNELHHQQQPFRSSPSSSSLPSTSPPACASPKSPTKSISARNVYSGMSVMLKSILTTTRSTPAYRISRRQSSDSYVVCYRVYLGQPTIDSLGSDTKQVRMGPISTPMGSVTMGVTYRTRLTLSPHKLDRTAPVMLKSDHFVQDQDLVSGTAGGASASFMGATRDSETRGSNKNLAGLFERQPFGKSKNIAAFVDYSSSDEAGAGLDQCLVPDLTASMPFPWIPDSSESSGSSSTRTNSMNLQHQQQQTSSSGRKPSTSSSTASPSLRKARGSVDRLSMASSESPPPEDFVVIDTSPPFATGESDCELGTFYNAFRTATPLLSTFDDQIDSVEEQLRALEVDRREFDSFVHDLESREDMNVSEATAADMSDDEDEDGAAKGDRNEEESGRRSGGGGRAASIVPMPLIPSIMPCSLWMSC